MRSPSPSRRALVAAVFAAAVLTPVAIPAAAQAAAVQIVPAAATTATAAADACTISQAQLTWGFKESFRSYISGTIARGAWETTDGATYETPVFTWSSGAGTVAADGSAADVAFVGGIHFTGHDGLLDTTVGSPTLVMDSPTHAVLRLDVSGVSMESALAGDETVTTVEQVPFVDIDLSGATITPGDGTIAISATDAPTAITADGFAAFGNYETGTAFDAITVQLAADCPVAESEPSATATATATPALVEADADADAGDAAQTSWGVLAGVVAGVVVVGAVVVAIVARRRRRATAPETPAPEDGPTPGAQP